jgi:two-component system CheB/CheR fusion protein
VRGPLLKRPFVAIPFVNTRRPLPPYLKARRRDGRAEAVLLRKGQAPRAHARRPLRVLELQHRSNNLLAVIQSIAQRSLAGDGSKKTFEARLQALARANRALVRSNWGGVDLNQLVRTELEVFSKRASISGASVLLSPQHAQNFTLALHELATNSAKYGAFSNATGKVQVTWTIEPDQSGSVLKFKWQESGGPPVSTPTRQGFGSQLLKGIFSDVSLKYLVEGLRCEIEVHLVAASRRVSPEGSQAELSLQDDAVVDG